MLKVFLVEDEKIVREGIKNNIDWEQEGYLFVGEASDGELAFPMIQENNPDIVITDIKMTFMDGLELSRLIKKEMPWIKIIVLSGYDEFEYAKEAIGIGVTDYLLKPITGEELIQAIHRVANMIEEERNKREDLDSRKRKTKKFFETLVSQKVSMTEVVEESKELDIDFTARFYNVLLGRFFDGNSDNGNTERTERAIDRLEEYVDASKAGVFVERANEGFAVAIKGNSKDAVSTTVKGITDEVVRIANDGNGVGMEYFIGVGVVVERISEMPKSFDMASKAFAYQYIISKNQVLYGEDLGKDDLANIDEVDLHQINLNTLDKNIIKNFLKTGTNHELERFLEEYFSGMGLSGLHSLLFRQYIVMNAYICCMNFIEKIGGNQKEYISLIGEFKELTQVFSTIDSTKDYVKDILMKAIKIRDSLADNKYADLIHRAKKYMQENYANENLSLAQVANSVNISQNHFSAIFSQETGQTFIEYLTGVRMEKAKELLRCSNRKSSEIAYQIGYKDPHYFSFLFKKTQNCTPKEYRAKGKET